MAIRSAETYSDRRDNQPKLARGVSLVKQDGEVDPIRDANADFANFDRRKLRAVASFSSDSRFAATIAQIDFKERI